MNKFIRIFIGFVIILTIVLIAIYGAMQLPAGKNLLQRSIIKITQDTDYRIDIGQINGDVFSDFTLEHLSIADKQGVWLTADQLHLVWHPLAVIATGDVINTVQADKLILLRLPAISTDKKLQPHPGFSLQSIIPYLPKQITLKDIFIEPEISATQQHLTLTANGTPQKYQVSLQTTEGPKTDLQADLSLKDLDINAAFKLNEEENGILGRLLSLPETSRLMIDVAMQTDIKNIVHLSKGKIELGNTALDLSGQYDQHKQFVKGAVSFQLYDLSEWQKLAKIPMQGDLNGTLHLSGPLNKIITEIKVHSASLTADKIVLTKTDFKSSGIIDGSNLQKLSFTTSGQLNSIFQQQNKTAQYILQSQYELQGNIPDKSFDGEIEANVTYQKNQFALKSKGRLNPNLLQIKNLNLQGVGVSIIGDGNWDRFKKLGSGQFNINITDLRPLADMAGIAASGKLQADGKLSAIDDKQQAEINIAALDLTYQNKNIRLQKNAHLNLQDHSAELSHAVFDFGGGTITTNGKIGPEHVNGVLLIKNMPLTPLLNSDALKGVTNGQITFSGTPQAPLIDMKATVKGNSGPYPVDVAINGQWKQNTLHVEATGKSTHTTAKMLASLKTTLSVWPFRTDLSDKTPINGSIVANMKLDIFNPALWSSRQQINGGIAGEMTMNGIIGTPELNGRFALNNASYIHSPSGICLNNVHANIIGTNKQITLQDLSSVDPKGGRLDGNARMMLDQEKALNGALNFRNFRLFCGGLATGNLDGHINATGTAQSSLIAGLLKLRPLNVQLPGAQHSTGIPEIDTIRINEEKLVLKDNQRLVRFNITLDAPSQIFVRGRGLDAEFGGALHIVGTADNPVINGDFKSRRGRFVLLDRNLQLTNALIRFEGPIPPSPFLDIEATSAVKATTITVDLEGPATKPKLTLTSSPTLPQDELLALLLFGRQLQNISPFEAIRLAQAARTLAGLDGGKPGVLDKARAKLGLDTLDVNTNDQNDVTVSTGKYVTDRVFVGVQQGAEPQDKQVKTEIELTPAISANTTIDAKGNQGVGLGWRHDY